MTAPRAPRAACPICARPVPADADPRHRPFCSARCAEVDLGRWFTGGYAIPVAEAEGEAGAGEGAAPQDGA